MLKNSMIVLFVLGVMVDCRGGQDQDHISQESSHEPASVVTSEQISPIDESGNKNVELAADSGDQMMYKNLESDASEDQEAVFQQQENKQEKKDNEIPLAPASDSVAGSDQDQSTIEGIDNVNIDEPQGNWLFKRIWWERAEALCDKIKKNIEEIFEQRMIFFTKRSELDKDVLDPFYLTIGMGQGEFKATLDELLASLEKEKDKKGFLSAGEREVVELLQSEQKTLEQLSLDLHAINQLEQQLDTSLAQLVDHMLDIRVYDRQAWNAFKEIARVIDDQEARKLYYTVDTAAHNIKDIGDYLGNAFYAHFDQLISTIREQTEKMSLTVKALREKGIDFKKQVELLTAPRPAQEKSHEVPEKDDEEDQEPEGFFATYFINPLKGLYDTIVSGILWPYHAIFGSSSEEESSEE